jgi:hypothetical protein
LNALTTLHSFDEETSNEQLDPSKVNEPFRLAGVAASIIRVQERQSDAALMRATGEAFAVQHGLSLEAIGELGLEVIGKLADALVHEWGQGA